MKKPIDTELVHFTRKMYNIQRLAGTFKLRSYNLAEHSFMVQQLFVEIAKAEDLPIIASDVILASRHDLLEAVTGDLLYPVKNLNSTTHSCWETIEDEVMDSYPVLRLYSDDNMKDGFSFPGLHEVMKAADTLDLWIFCKEEEALGNSTGNLKKVIIECNKLLVEKFNFKSVTKFMKEFTID